MTIQYCTPTDVIQFTNVKPTDFGLDHKYKVDPDTDLTSMISDWIDQAVGLIDSYCNNPKHFDPCPQAVKNVCIRLVTNMVALGIQRKNGGMVKYNDWTVTLTSSNIFTQDLKNDLEPYTVEGITQDQEGLTLFAITGEDETTLDDDL